MQQAKFINVFGQWVHPTLHLVQNDNCTVLFNVQHAILFEVCKAGIFFKDKTIDEVAEEYNRQVDLINKQKLDLKIIQGDQESTLFINGVESWTFEGGEIWGFTGLLKDLGYPAVTVETKK